MRKKLRKRLVSVVLGVLITLALLSCIAIVLSRWLGASPYGGSVVGTVVSKTIVVYQGRRTRVEYFAIVKTTAGQEERVAITQDMYRQLDKGWHLQQQRNVVTVSSPDGARSLGSSVVY